MKRLGLVALGAALIAGAAIAQTTGSWPVATITSLSNATSTQVAQANPSRRFLQICNVSASPNHVWIAPINPSGVTAVTPAANNGIFLSAVPSAAFSSVYKASDSCYTAPVSGGLGAGWNAVAPTSSATILTLDY